MKEAKKMLPLRLSTELFKKLSKQSAAQKVSMNRWCTMALEQSLGAKSDQLYEQTERIAKHFQQDLDGIVLFGSQVRFDATESSDIDLLLVLKSGTPIHRGLYSSWETIDLNNKKISPQFVCLPTEPSHVGGLWYEVAIEGRVLWDRVGHVSRFLSELRLWMIQAQLKRKWSHGHPYWVKHEK